jgi:formylglycine-generating enzyme required for sulfatase activity
MGRIISAPVFAIAVLAISISSPLTLAQGAPAIAEEPPVQSAWFAGVEEWTDLRDARPLSRNEERALRPLDPFKECELCPEMIAVGPGHFLMGASEEESGSTGNERPQHEVSFAEPFAIGRFAVTMSEWDACVADRGCSYRPADHGFGRGTQPAINILWDDAQEYVAWLSRKTGRSYRLPSEAEREYVARAGTTTAYWWGDEFLPAQANCDSANRGLIAASTADAQASARPLPVQSFAPNPWGFYQVHGNVYDWVEDCWNDNYNGAPSDGSAWTDGRCDRHVLRGGAFSRNAQTARSAARLWSASPNRMIYMSVRVARTMRR